MHGTRSVLSRSVDCACIAAAIAGCGGNVNKGDNATAPPHLSVPMARLRRDSYSPSGRQRRRRAGCFRFETLGNERFWTDAARGCPKALRMRR